MEDAALSIRSKLREKSPVSSGFMHKVPTYLREVREKAYEPRIVSIGPYQAGKPEYKKMEQVKLGIMEYLLEWNPEKQIEAYVSRVAAMEEMARNCYVEPIALSCAKFIEMLVLDACFIIHVTTFQDSPFVCRSDDSEVRSDLVLFENQIPFFILCDLFDLIVGPDKLHQLMECVLITCGGALDVKRLNQREAGDVNHILHLVHMNLSPWRHSPDDDDDALDYYTIPTVVELRGANVVFKKKLDDASASPSPFDVEFEGGVMRIPALPFYDGTERLLRNLIAYEQHFPRNLLAYVTDYAVLLDCLINSSEDVKILCRHDIIQNYLGDDQAIVDIVNRLCENITLTSNKMFMHRETFRLVNIHRKKWWNRAEAALRRDYFNTPWALLSFLAALLLLLLTIAQTILTALQLKN